ncbi:Double-stranded RNA-binding protein 5 [Nymphaea thermarum]|nr:Double-stranded RNA-binding protein 5 [Nymphaea thermarum]
MYKNQLQELAQRSCFNLPSYACIREGPDHAPRFRASVNFNGEIFEGPSYCTTLRQAEHAAAEVALNTLSTRAPPKSLAAKVLDETGVYKNLLQETAHRAGLNLPVYTTVRSGPGHMPVFTCTVELAGMTFNGDPAKTKKQAEKNAAMAAWSALKQLPNLNSLFQISKESDNGEEQEQVIVARALSSLRPKDETNKAVRQREHQQNLARKRMMMNYKDKYLIHSQTSLQCQQWGSPDLLSEQSYATQQQPQQQQGVFVSISAPRACSKLLPPVNIYHHQQQKPKESPSQSSGSVCSKEAAPPPSLALNQTRAIPVQIRSKPQVRAEEVPPPIEEHQRDEEEWLNGRKTEQHVPSKAIEKEANPSCTSNAFRPKPNFSKPFLPLNLQPEQNTEPTLIRSLKNFRVPAPPPMAHRSPILPPRMFCGSDFPSHAMAPAVHIRSVIPVCAAPPVRPPSPSPPPPPPEQVQKQEASCSNAQDISQAASKMNSLSI